jgi:hypothetical protein
MKRTTIVELIALFFTMLFLYTGIAKLIDYNVAKEQIALSPLLAPVSSEVVIMLPLIEIIAAALLFIPSTRRIALIASLGLMLLFTAYVAYILLYNDQLPCTCGGVLQEMTWPQHLFFNIACISLLISAIFLNRPRKHKIADIKYSPLQGSHI